MQKLFILVLFCCNFAFVSCYTVIINETEAVNNSEPEQVIVIIEQPVIIHPPHKPHPRPPRPPMPTPRPPIYKPEKKKPVATKPERKKPSTPIAPSRPVRKKPKEKIKKAPM
ncbi:MAG: hypothetical protein D8M58_05270 [Calditrichaeota bacterium]|nr:MAG: hypothetical protein DWQ03_21235 [Calditrichota bacterium]MBL1204785.1 hypothetical protein [Calditrichota bacterium]NOG44614.1 hypothetical protein [Calditrichota bacterium]